MPIPAAAEESVELFNTLITLRPDQDAEIRRILWQLRGLRSKFPHNIEIALAYTEALVMLGEAQEALAVIDQAWRDRRSLATDFKYALAFNLQGLGLYRQALELASEMLRGENKFLNRRLAVMVQYAAWGLGDVEKIRWALSLFPGPATASWDAMLERLAAVNLLEHLPEHQRIVRDVVFGHQTSASLLLSVDEDYGLELTECIYVGDDREERSRMEEQIHDRLDEYFASQGLSDKPHWDLITPLVMHASAAPRRFAPADPEVQEA
jgi:tetratricopeptide (TPR) repeat protein